MTRLFWKTLMDLKHPRILWRLFIPFLISIALVSLMGYSAFALFFTSEWFLQNPVIVEMEAAATTTEQWLMGIPLIGGMLVWVLGFLITILVGVVGLLMGSYLVLLVAMVITGFMTDSLIKAVRDQHYPDQEYSGHGHFLGLIAQIAGFGLLMLLVMLLGLPLFFIPLVNLVWVWTLGFIFFRYALLLDVGQVILSEPEYREAKSIRHWTPTLGMIILYSLTLFPLVSFFAPVLGVIFLAHWMFERRAAPVVLEH
ncbi:EI24 domain-containing protein [Marinospirillum perlucidum]|uniref:EI24 domain-containing protein n=1 Tax=Marinospirillum perlucidum TaxID=1982602 RepID=UPI000DF225EC|nr:EI24 domain-containing protein [Marinospirillum perlucidum]